MVRKLEEKLAAIHAIRDAPAGHDALLRDALRSKAGLLIAAATKIVAAHAVEALIDELAPAFARLLDRPIERDPGCRGKVAIARALHDLDRWDDDVFAAAVRHVQKEPVWGGTEDTAGELRAVAALAYAHAGHADALDLLGELLGDPLGAVRSAAGTALGETGQAAATAILRHKAVIGDEEPSVLICCFAALLVLSKDRSLPFVARWLDDTELRAEAAAIALGDSHLEEAFPLLMAWCERCPPPVRTRVGYLALALLRYEPATARLVELVASGDTIDARAAIRALGAFRYDPELCVRVRAAGARNPDPEVGADADETFPSESL